MERASKFLFYLSMALIVYMPLHVFIVQSVSLATGGLEVWKAAKDVLVFMLVPLLLFLAYKKRLFEGKYKWHFLLGLLYVLIHLLFVVFDSNDDTYSAVVATVYNSRLLVYFLIGLLLGSYKLGEKYLKWLLTAALLVACVVALFGVLQYFLPSDLLENVGYSLDRGVKPLFFIDDNPDLPRVMSTLKDPNSLGAYLIVPILLAGYALVSQTANSKLFVRPFRREVLSSMLLCMLGALFLTFSRGAVVGLAISIVTILSVVNGEGALRFLRKYWYVPVVLVSIITLSTIALRNTDLVQDYVFHAAKTSNDLDPNEKRLSLQRDAIEDIIEQPQGYGPGSAGLVAIRNPQGVILTENYYLQIGYEVGWLGLVLFIAILSIISYQLVIIARYSPLGAVCLASLAAYLFYSLLIHLWSNEAVALQWWLLTGMVLSQLSTNYSGNKL